MGLVGWWIISWWLFDHPYHSFHDQNYQDGIVAYLLWGWWGGGLIQPTFPLQPKFAGESYHSIAKLIMIIIVTFLIILVIQLQNEHYDNCHLSDQSCQQNSGTSLGVLLLGWLLDTYLRSLKTRTTLLNSKPSQLWWWSLCVVYYQLHHWTVNQVNQDDFNEDKSTWLADEYAFAELQKA